MAWMRNVTLSALDIASSPFFHLNYLWLEGINNTSLVYSQIGADSIAGQADLKGISLPGISIGVRSLKAPSFRQAIRWQLYRN